jgi:hypothetical protein
MRRITRIRMVYSSPHDLLRISVSGGRSALHYLLTMKNTLSIALTIVAALTSACLGYERKSTLGPTSSGIGALLGNWSSTNLVPSANTCSDFKWNVAEQTGNSASGTFSATCAGDLRISGTASGTLSGSAINWNAQATASVPGLPSCAITLSGTAELGVDSIRVPYSGDTCLAKVSGVEVLRKR